jgi:hypothetical protein
MAGEETRVIKNAYRRRNMNVLSDYLEELILLVAGEIGQEVIEESNGGFQKITVDTTVKLLTVPADAVSATLQLEADTSTTNKQKVIRVKYNGSNPTLTDGFVYEDGIIIPLAGRDNLQKLRVIGLEAGKQHILWVQYYRSAGNNTGT